MRIVGIIKIFEWLRSQKIGNLCAYRYEDYKNLKGVIFLNQKLGPYDLNTVTHGNCLDLAAKLPDDSIDIIVTSPPYWGQRLSAGTGMEEDPRDYITALKNIFLAFLPKLKPQGICWINIGDAYNTPVNWGRNDWKYSSLGADKLGFHKDNSAYTKPRAKRKAFINRDESWLTYGNLLALPNRLVISLCDDGYIYRGEVIWRKKNAMPEGRCRRPHRQHESIFLLARDDNHFFVCPLQSEVCGSFQTSG